MSEGNESGINSGTSKKTSVGNQKKIEEGIYSLTFAVNKSIRYHSKRRRFFDNLHKGSNALTAIFGSATFVAVLSNNQSDNHKIALFASALVAILTSFDLVIGFSEKARQYDDLQKRFSNLLREIILGHNTSDNLIKWKAERISIEKDEPTFLTLLNTICHNEEALACSHDGHVVDGIGWRGSLSHFCSFDRFHQDLMKKHNKKQKEDSEI